MSGHATGAARVLIVDDDPDVRWMTAEALGDCYEIAGAASATEALVLVRQWVPDAIVVDLSLGQESGWDLIRSLQADRALGVVPIAVLSARVPTPPPGVGPCAAYLTKPCPVAKLRVVLTRLVGEQPCAEKPLVQ